MAERKSVYIGSNLAYVINPLATLLGSESSACNAIGDRYRELIRSERPEFTLEQWVAIARANNLRWNMVSPGDAPRLEMISVFQPEQQNANAGVINGRLLRLTVAQRLAALDVIERAYAQGGELKESLRSALAERIADPHAPS